MTTTNEEIRGFLDKSGYRYAFDETQGYFSLSFNTKTYRNLAGKASLFLIFYAMDDGNTFGIVAPRLYVVSDAPSEAPVTRALLFASSIRNLVRFELDIDDGEVAASVVIPVANSRLTEQQIDVALESLLIAIDETYLMIMRARDTGEVRVLSLAEAEVQGLIERTRYLTDEGRAKVIQALDEALAKAGYSASSDSLERL